MKLHIGYFADGPWSHEAFKKIIQDNEIIISFICVRFDTLDTTLKKFAEKYGINYLKHENVNSPDFITQIKAYECDLFVSMSFNQIFKEELINIPKLKTINCHAGKLPFYRGRNILNWALINDESDFGITVHFVDEGIDTGDIVLQRTYPIYDTDDYSTLLQVAYHECASILYEALTLFKNNTFERKKQTDIHPTGFYCTQRKIGDELLDWNQTSREIFNFVRAICRPGPMARAFLNGTEIKINRVQYSQEVPKYKCVIGAVLTKDSTGFWVKTKDSCIKVVEYEGNINVKVGDRFELK